MIDRNLLGLPKAKALIAALGAFALLQAAATFGQVLGLSAAIAMLWEGATTADAAPHLAVFLGCLAAARAVVFAQDAVLDRFAARRAAELQGMLLGQVFDPRKMPARTEGTGAVAALATEGIASVERYLRIIPPKMTGIAFIALPLLAAEFALDWTSGVILLVLLPVIAGFMVMLGRQARERASRQYGEYRRLANRFLDTVRGLGAIVAAGSGEAEASSVRSFSEKLRSATVRTMATATLSGAVLDLCATFGVAAVAMMLAFRLMDGSLGLPTALAALMLAPECFAPIRAFAGDFHASLDGKNALADVLGVIGHGAPGARPEDGLNNAAHASGTCTGEDAVEGAVLELRQVAYSYGSDRAPAVEGVDLVLRVGEHVAVVGESGAGKSTLAALAAGLTAPTEGTVHARGRVLFIPQDPHVFRMSLADNVRFYRPAATDEEVMRAVRAVGLQGLVGELPQGLQTMVGEGLRGLSGGEAHRVAVARALLCDDARVLVFDEPTAHLDVQTEIDLKRELLPLLEGRAVLFATHRMHWVGDMHRVVELRDGRIVRDEAVTGRPAVRAAAGPAGSGMRPATRCETAALRAAHRQAGDSEPSAPCPAGRFERVPSPRDECAAEHGVPADRNAASPLPGAPWLKRLVGRYGRNAAAAIALGAVATGSTALLMFTAGYLICATASPNVTLFSIMVPVAFVQLFGLGRPIARYAERLVSHDWVLRVTSDLRALLFQPLLDAQGDPRRQRTAGEYLGMLEDDIGHLQDLYLRALFPMAMSLATVLGSCVAFGAFSPPFAGTMLALFALTAAVAPLACMRWVRGPAREARSGRAGEYPALVDDISGAIDWALAGRADEASRRHARTAAVIRGSEARVRLRERLLGLAASLALGAGTCAVASWAGGLFGPAGQVASPNLIAAFALGFLPLVETVSALPAAAAAVPSHAESIAGLGRVVEAKHASRRAVTPAVDPVERFSATFPRDVRDGRGAIELRGVSYRYPGSARPALDGMSIAIPAGQKAAVLGRSGAGKSTLALMALGRLAPDAGSVLVNGSPIAPRETDLSRTVGYLGQDPYLFDRTLRENLTMGVFDRTDDELAAILRDVGLETALNRLPDGLDTPVGETGTGLSGGQAHRVALARVLAADCPIVIVDEPFAALDPETGRSLTNTLLRACAGRTLVVITHHLACIEEFDRVMFVQDGRITLDGSPTALARESEAFKELLDFDR